MSRLAGRRWDHCKTLAQITMYDEGLQKEIVNIKLESVSQCGFKGQMQHCMFLQLPGASHGLFYRLL